MKQEDRNLTYIFLPVGTMCLSHKAVTSALTPNLGIVHEYKTSVAVTMIRMNVFIGRIDSSIQSSLEFRLQNNNS